MENLIQKRPFDFEIRFLNGKWMLKERRLDDAYSQVMHSIKLKDTVQAQTLRAKIL